MDQVILGFLLIKALSQYDILQALQKEASPFYQASLGSIQNALKKLVKQEYVILTKTSNGGRKKNLYSITDKGREAFITFMLGDYTNNRFEAEVSTKLFFLGLMEKPVRVSVINQTIHFLEGEIEVLKASEHLYKQKEISEDLALIAKYQFKTLDLGLFQYTQLLNWFKVLSKEEI